jgi:taurine dioxygenase
MRWREGQGEAVSLEGTTRRLAGALGVEVTGVDLAAPIDEALRTALRRAWLDAGVLVFRDQRLSDDGFAAVARLFGEPAEYPFLKGRPGHATITEVVKLEHEQVNFGGVWHSDTTYLAAPPIATLLIARETPPYGGDTLFACQAAAFAALSPVMQRLLEALRGVNNSANPAAARTREERIKDAGRDDGPETLEAVHPVVRTHPETRRRSLYINPAHTIRFDGMTEEESAPLLDYLFRHQVRPEFTCRVEWRPGTLAIWDNRSVLHNPVNDYHGHRRVMHRITLAGEIPA